MPLGIMISNAKINQDDYKIISYVITSSIIGLFLSLIIIICLFNLELVLRFFGQDAEIVRLVGRYIDIFVWSVPALAISQVLSQFAFGMLKQQFVLILNIFSTLLFSIFGYMLVFGKGGFTSMGIEGIALACNIKFWVNCICLIVFFSSYKVDYEKKITGTKFINREIVYEILIKGLPFMANSLLYSLYMFIINLFTGWLGFAALIINQLSFQLYSIMYIILDSLAYSCSVLVGRMNHKTMYEQIKLLLIYNLITAIILVFISAITLYIFFNEFIDFFIKEKRIIDFSLRYELKLTFFWVIAVFVFEAIISTLKGGLFGLLDIKTPALLCIIFDWLIAVPLTYFLIMYFDFGFRAIFFAKTISLVFSSYLLAKRLISKLSVRIESFKLS